MKAEEYSSSTDEKTADECSAFVDSKTFTLNHGRSFGVFDRWGDVYNTGQNLQGIFHRGTRYISKLEFKVLGVRPLFLSSTVREDNDVLSVDLVNPKLRKTKTPEEDSVIHIKRKKFIHNDEVYDKFIFRNYSNKDVALSFSLHVDADFKDIFELKGFQRKSKHGKVQKIIGPQRLEMIYDSVDKIKRKTVVRTSATCEVNEEGFNFQISLKPNEKLEHEVTYSLFFDETPMKEISFLESKKQLEHEINQLRNSIATIHTSNEQVNHWVNRSSVDLISLLDKHEQNWYPNAGIPWYNTVFGRDGLITAAQLIIFSPFIAQGVLRHLAKNQAKEQNDEEDSAPGKILHELRDGELANLGELPFQRYYGSADATPLFIWLAGIYYERTADLETLKIIWPEIKAALKWIDEFGDMDQDGFVEYHKKSQDGLDNQGWKDSFDSISYHDGNLVQGPIALSEVQAYVYQAKLQAAKLAKVMGEEGFSDKLNEQAIQLRKKFNDVFWDDYNNFIPIALDGQKNPAMVISSNAGHCLAAEILDDARADKVTEKLFSPDMFSGWGIRTLSRDELRYNPMSYHNGSIWPHDNAIIAYGLRKYKKKKELLTLASAIFDASLYLELQRIPELYCGFERTKGEGPTLYPVACSPQAWAVGTVFMLISALLGLEINATEKKVSFNYPTLPNFINELNLRKVFLSPNENFDCRCIRYGEDVGVDVISVPQDWTVVIVK